MPLKARQKQAQNKQTRKDIAASRDDIVLHYYTCS